MTRHEALHVFDRMLELHGCMGFKCSDCSDASVPVTCPVVEALETLKAAAPSEGKADG